MILDLIASAPLLEVLIILTQDSDRMDHNLLPIVEHSRHRRLRLPRLDMFSLQTDSARIRGLLDALPFPHTSFSIQVDRVIYSDDIENQYRAAKFDHMTRFWAEKSSGKTQPLVILETWEEPRSIIRFSSGPGHAIGPRVHFSSTCNLSAHQSLVKHVDRLDMFYYLNYDQFLEAH
jgi:hypothetical protein